MDEGFIRYLNIIIFLMIATFTGIINAQQQGWYTEGNFEAAIRMKVVVVNPLNVDRKDCPVTIERSMMPFVSFYEASVFVVDPLLPSQPDPTFEQAKAIGSGVTFKETNGHSIPYQLDDLDKDGVWDELYFVTDFKPNEEKLFFVYIGENDRGWFEHKTHSEIGAYCRHIVPWWESELMGWKLWYFSDVDLYGKCEPMLVSNHENTTNTSGYTAGSKFGNDIMTVEDSFGAGGICLYEDASQPDKVSRPRFSPYRGEGQLNDTRYAYEVVCNGSIRSMIKVYIMNWRTGKGNYELEQTYTAYKNKSYSTCKVNYLRFIPGNNETTFGCGIRKLMNEVEFCEGKGSMISLAKNVDIFDPDVQTQFATRFLVDFMGTAMVLKNPNNSEYQFVNDFDGNHTLRFPLNEDKSFEYLIAAGWSNGSVNKTPDEFQSYVYSITNEYRNPIEIKSVSFEKK